MEETNSARDKLATERTHLANDRTLLAYIRTALVLLGPGITLIKLFPDDLMMIIVGSLCIPSALIFVFLGFNSHRNMRRKIQRQIFIDIEEKEKTPPEQGLNSSNRDDQA